MLAPHRAPPPPPRLPRDGGTGERLADLPRRPSAPGPVRPRAAAGLPRLRAQPGHHGVPPRVALEAPVWAPLQPPPLLLWLPRPHGPAVGPAPERTPGPAGGAGAGGWLPPATRCAAGRRLARSGLGTEGRQRPRPAPPLGGVPSGPGRLVGPGADAAGASPLARRRDRGLRPPPASPLLRLGLVPRRRCYPTRQGASQASALGVRPGPGCAWPRSAGRPGTCYRRATGSWATGPSRAVALPRPPASRGRRRSLRGGGATRGGASGTAASRGACLATGAPAPAVHGGRARHLTPSALGRARAPAGWAGRRATRASGEVGARHGVLLANREALSKGLHTARHCLATPLR
jgi:hypothetical protein